MRELLAYKLIPFLTLYIEVSSVGKRFREEREGKGKGEGKERGEGRGEGVDRLEDVIQFQQT